jgi:hypothetical protein
VLDRHGVVRTAPKVLPSRENRIGICWGPGAPATRMRPGSPGQVSYFAGVAAHVPLASRTDAISSSRKCRSLLTTSTPPVPATLRTSIGGLALNTSGYRDLLACLAPLHLGIEIGMRVCFVWVLSPVRTWIGHRLPLLPSTLSSAIPLATNSALAIIVAFATD